MDVDNPFFQFELMYADQIVICKVIMQTNGYEVLFDGRWMAAVAHTEDWNWVQASGVILPQKIIDEIGLRIESEYK
ncbi:hypothetical protein D0C36_22755 [Mucilaginibacter conchicola]|uniref:Uncharacterized protein n=1 Tax=Mucilaginibacter conchicola TaxID=2303333 RepID=A0A372NM93_9SPHI|nr:hypothetical protein [Mucilaginibacter conchicola]RFZ90066.1 hypothetical protein D0C36_22755 [Mucilaginibacter conchicola]